MTDPITIVRQALEEPYKDAEKCRRVFLAVLEAVREPGRGVIQAMETAVEDSIDSTSDTYGSYDVWDANSVANAVHRAAVDTLIEEAKAGS
jgi:hypothetical protein